VVTAEHPGHDRQTTPVWSGQPMASFAMPSQPAWCVAHSGYWTITRSTARGGEHQGELRAQGGPAACPGAGVWVAGALTPMRKPSSGQRTDDGEDQDHGVHRVCRSVRQETRPRPAPTAARDGKRSRCRRSR
jgi:hypothetical protein